MGKSSRSYDDRWDADIARVWGWLELLVEVGVASQWWLDVAVGGTAECYYGKMKLEYLERALRYGPGGSGEDVAVGLSDFERRRLRVREAGW